MNQKTVKRGLTKTGGVSWFTSCPDCIDAGDYFKLVDGKMEGQDSNGPATWTTDPIDISDCEYIEISFDLSEEGDMEACGTGCNSVDFVMFEYNIDGSGWTTPADAYFCSGDCAGVFVIHSDDILGDILTYQTGCMDGGDEIEIRVTIQAWAASERWQLDNVTVTCTDGPEIDAGEDQIVCEGTVVILEADNPEGADLNWDHDVVDGVGFTPGVGEEDYVVTATDGVCTATDTVIVEVIPPVTVTLTPAGPFAEGSGIQTLEAEPGSGTWSADCVDCIDSITGEFDPAEAGIGIWEVCYTAGIETCADTACMYVEVIEDCELTYSISFISPSCFGDENGSATIDVLDPTGSVTYTITNSLGETVNEDNENFATALSGGWYYFEVVDELPCFAYDSVYLEIPAAMSMDFTLIEPTCHDDLGHATIDTVYNYTGDYTDVHYAWEPIGLSGAGLSTASDLGDGAYSVVITDANGCEISTSFDISVPAPLLFSSVNLNHLNCFDVADGSIDIEATGGVLPYSFSLDGGPFIGDPVFTDLTGGLYTIELMDVNGCLNDTTVILTSPPALTHDALANNESCDGTCDGEITLDATGGTGAYTFSIDACLTAAETPTFTDLCAGEYAICITDENGCSTNSTVTIEAGEPVVDGSIITPALICENDSPFLIETEYTGELSGSGVIGETFNPSVAGVGNHTILNAFDGTCTEDYTATFVVLPSPEIVFATNKTDGCAPLQVSFENIGDPGVSYTWTTGDGASIDGISTLDYTYTESGIFSPGLTVTADNGCSNTITYEDYISVYEQPVANFSYLPKPVTTAEPIVNFTDQSNDAISWVWNFNDLGTSNEENPSFTFPNTAGTYPVELIVTSEGGCSDTIIKMIQLIEPFSIYVPNAFTPDGNSVNNSFKPYINGIDIYHYTFTIYNRWGETLFVSHDPSVGWDGSYGGEIVESGVYIYHIVASESSSDKRMEHHGHVTLLR